MDKRQKHLLIIIFLTFWISSACDGNTLPVSNIPSPTPVSKMSSFAGQIVYQGKIKLHADVETNNPDAFLNLKTGVISDASLGDIELVISRGGGGTYFYFLQPVNGTKANRIDTGKPGLKGCLDTASVLTNGNIPGIKIGDYICAVTNDGYLAQIIIQDIDMSKIANGWLEIAIITWKISS